MAHGESAPTHQPRGDDKVTELFPQPGKTAAIERILDTQAPRVLASFTQDFKLHGVIGTPQQVHDYIYAATLGQQLTDIIAMPFEGGADAEKLLDITKVAFNTFTQLDS